MHYQFRILEERLRFTLQVTYTESTYIYLSIYLKGQDYGDVGAEAQQGRLTM